MRYETLDNNGFVRRSGAGEFNRLPDGFPAAFDTTDREETLRTTIATLQDLGFVIDKADADLGAVSATKLDRYMLRMTVTVRPRGQTQILVRANAQFGVKEVNDPEPYQDFFAALGRAMFLTAQQVD
jgi:hypothetical protein